MLSGRIFPSELLACCVTLKCLEIYSIMHIGNTLCPPGYHHNVFMRIPGLGHRMYGLVLIFSHGQASVESGFSINSSIMVENLHEESSVNSVLVV